MRSPESASFIAKVALVASTLAGPQACSMRDPDDMKKIETLESELASTKSELAAAKGVNDKCTGTEGELHQCLGEFQSCKKDVIAFKSIGDVDDELLESCKRTLASTRKEADSYKAAAEICKGSLERVLGILDSPIKR